jgi:hypothetical protein
MMTTRSFGLFNCATDPLDSCCGSPPRGRRVVLALLGLSDEYPSVSAYKVGVGVVSHQGGLPGVCEPEARLRADAGGYRLTLGRKSQDVSTVMSPVVLPSADEKGDRERRSSPGLQTRPGPRENCAALVT